MPRTPPPAPDRDADPEAWERWVERQGRNLRARERRGERRDRLAYPADDTPLVAEASCEGTFFRPPPLPPSVLRVSIRLRSPLSRLPHDHAVHFEWTALTENPSIAWLSWHGLLRPLADASSAAFHSVPHPWPKGGFDIELTRLELEPPLKPSSSPVETGRFAVALAEIYQSAVRMAFAGLVAYNLQDSYVEAPSIEPC